MHGEFMKKELGAGMVGGDIEHIGLPMSRRKYIDQGGDETNQDKYRQGGQESPGA